ncbi:hypothetical protein KM043_002686 [Ampulex compressa]|nr:hypothetical protein KM043_002686 [Ampulex compressa]
MRPWRNKSFGLGIAGLLLIILGTFLALFRQWLFHHILQKGIGLSPSSATFEFWKDTSLLPPLYMNIYLFNWTNPNELKIPGKKPILAQTGPYMFREIKQKVNITFHPENGTVSYYQQRFWYFDAERSNGSLQDQVIQLNPVALSAAHKSRYWEYWVQTSLSILLGSSGISVMKPVGELLFDGYSDPLITMGKSMNMDDDMPPFDRFGWFYKRNGSSEMDGNFNMATGFDDMSEVGVLRKWNFKDTTKFFKSPCNVVEGSAGEFWPPGRTKDDISLFSSELCRPLVYQYDRTVNLLGIDGYRFSLGDKTFNNATTGRYHQEQAKFFDPTTTTEYSLEDESSAETTEQPDEDSEVLDMGQCYCNGECTPMGLLNVSACRYGAPAFVSLPHFYKGDPILTEQFVGLDPKEEKHNFHIVLEPTTGVPLEVAAKLQVNLLLQPSKTISLYSNVPKLYFPAFWFEIHVQPTEDMMFGLKQLLSIPSICLYVGLIMALTGCCIVFAITLLCVVQKKREDKVDVKPGNADATVDKKFELVYLDNKANNGSEDVHVRNDRRLFPKIY